MMRNLLLAGSVINFLGAVFHMFFWKLLDWSVELPKLNELNRGIYQIANIVIIFVILYFSVISFYMSRFKKLDFSSKSIIILIIGFYSSRILGGIVFFGLNSEEIVVWLICLMIMCLYGAVLILEKRKRV